MGLLFFPRGGSSHVARSLARALPHAGWDARVLSGSLAGHGEAREFYRGLDVVPVEMDGALEAPDPLLADPPLHPSYEDREGAPDRVMASLDDDTYEHHVHAWARALTRAGAAEHDVLHLHHLTPLHEAAARVAPGVPVVGHLHGTELLMLEEIEEGGVDWPHAEAWAERLRGWAQRCERLIVLSDSQVERAERLLGIEAERCVRVANGFNPETFDQFDVPREPGVQIIYVGRFTKVKRVPLLIEAFAAAQPSFEQPARLVIVGGFPGEHEAEHPEETIRRTGARDVHLAGWHSHDELPEFLNASDVIVLPSVREQFGQVLVEAMACGLPAIAVDAHGPKEIVEDGETGWLVAPDDREGLTRALVEAVNDGEERTRRGEAARAEVRARYAWPALAEQVATVYEEAVTAGPGAALRG